MPCAGHGARRRRNGGGVARGRPEGLGEDAGFHVKLSIPHGWRSGPGGGELWRWTLGGSEAIHDCPGCGRNEYCKGGPAAAETCVGGRPEFSRNMGGGPGIVSAVRLPWGAVLADLGRWPWRPLTVSWSRSWPGTATKGAAGYRPLQGRS